MIATCASTVWVAMLWSAGETCRQTMMEQAGGGSLQHRVQLLEFSGRWLAQIVY